MDLPHTSSCAFSGQKASLKVQLIRLQSTQPVEPQPREICPTTSIMLR